MAERHVYYYVWKKEVDSLVGELLKKEILLRQYSMWLEASEENSIYKGKDVYDMLIGTLYGLGANLDFMPGVGWQNFIAVIGEVQRKSGLDLGVCRFLDDDIIKIKAELEAGEKLEGTYRSKCAVKENLLVAFLHTCIPPNRIDCPHRKASR